MIGERADRQVGDEPARPSSLARGLLSGRGWIPALVGACVLGGIAALLALSLSSSSTKPGVAASGPSIGVGRSHLGTILVDDRGRTLYMFTHDRPRSSSCTASCALVWPPATASGSPTVARGVSRPKLTTLRRVDGRTQLVYAGHPLYRFSEDVHPGQVGGQGFLGAWFVVAPSGQKIGKATSGSVY